MTVYEVTGDPWWCHCPACKTSGDIVNVARDRWKLDSTDTKPFGAEDLKLSVGSERVRQDIDQFWASCTDGNSYDHELYRSCGLSDAPHHSRQRFLEHVGFTSSSQVRDFTSKARLKCTPFIAGSVRRRFMVTRLFDLPGRVRGFLLQGEEHLHQILPYMDPPEGSLFGSLQDAKADTIVCNSFQIVSKFYARAAREGMPCPMVGIYRRPSLAAIRHSLPNMPICWSPDNLSRAIHMARLINGQVSLAGASDFGQHSVLQQLAMIRQQVVSWQEAIHRVVGREDEAAISQLLSDMDWSTAERRQFLDTSPAYVQDTIQRLDTPRDITNIRVKHAHILELSDGWYTKTGDLITDAAVRLEQVTHDAAGKATYQAIIRFKGQEHHCRIPAEEAEKQLFRWVHLWLRDKARVGVSRFNKAWNSHGLEIALAFHAPEIAQVTGLGWQQSVQAFQLPGYRLEAGGVVVESSPYELATVSLPRPSRLAAEVLKRLSTAGDHVELVWATVAAVAANIVAPAVGKPRPGLLIVGERAWEPVAELATALGCPTWGTLVDRSRVPAWQLKQELVGEHRWPGVLRTVWSKRWRPRLQEWTGNDSESLICQVDGEAAFSLLSQDNWLAICPQMAPSISRELREDASRVLANWLADLCQRRLRLATLGDYAAAVVADLEDWFQREGGDPSIVRRANHWVLSQDRLVEFFTRLINTKRRNGDIRSLAQPTHTAIVTLDDGVWVPDLLIDRLPVDARMGFDVNKVAFEAALSAAGAGSRRQLQQHSGWFVRNKNWSTISLCDRLPRTKLL